MRLKGKVCIVTGGGSGIGRATCLLFAKEGASVVVADKRQEAAEAVAAEGSAAGATMLPTMMDVSRDDDAQRVVHQTVEAFGRLDVLVNNAGYGFAGTVVDTDEEAWDDLMAVNVRGVYLCSKHAIPALARAIAIDHVAEGIRCNAVAPGTIDTPYFDEILRKSPVAADSRRALEARQLLGRLGTPEEIAAGILFLASDESRFATGTILTIDGGMTAQ